MLLDMSPPPRRFFPSRAENISQGERSNTGKLLTVGAGSSIQLPVPRIYFFEKSTSLKKKSVCMGGCMDAVSTV